VYTGMRLVPAVLLALLFASPLLRAADTKDIEKIQKDIADLRKDITQLQNDMRAESLNRNAIQEQLNEILRRLDRLAQQQESAYQRISRFGPPPPAPGGALSTTATIVIQNQYDAPATVFINGRAITVNPFQTIQVPGVPTGSFEYSVDVEGRGLVQAPGRHTLPASGYRIRIFPAY
jgi:outer membrane murein-binding lipoprotein Lpp